MKINPNDSVQPSRVWEDSVAGDVLSHKPGMNIRTHLAAMFAKGLISHYGGANPKSTAKMSVECADALIEELNK